MRTDASSRRKLPFLPLLLGLSLLPARGAARDRLPPPQPERGSIGIVLRARAPVRIIRSTAVQVIFVPLEEGADPLAGEFVQPSNFADRGQVFLLNAKPGRYVVVAATLPGAPGWKSQSFLAQELIPQTEVEVRAGELVFAGDYMLLNDMESGNGDPAQKHYIERVAPSTSAKGYFSRSRSGEGLYLAKLEKVDRSPETEKAFWRKAAAGALRDSKAWKALTEMRIAALSAPKTAPEPAQP